MKKNLTTDIAYDHIRRNILSGEFPQGYALETALLAKKIGVSRTPVRDALRKLEADGLVTFVPHVGAQVKRLQMDEFRELCDYRLALECHAAALAAVHRTENDLQEMRFALEAVRSIGERIKSNGPGPALRKEIVMKDASFHVAIMEASKNQIMRKEIFRLHVLNRLILRPVAQEELAVDKTERAARLTAILDGHDEIFDAIARSDAESARRAMQSHIEGVIANLLRVVWKSEPPPTSRNVNLEEIAYMA